MGGVRARARERERVSGEGGSRMRARERTCHCPCVTTVLLSPAMVTEAVSLAALKDAVLG